MKIKKAYTRHYLDKGQTIAYVEWIDSKGNVGRTEDRICSRADDPPNTPASPQMRALFEQARRERLTIEHEIW